MLQQQKSRKDIHITNKAIDSMLNDMSQTKVMITKDCSPFVLCKRTILETAIFLRVERREAHAIELEQYPKVPYHV